MKIGIYYGSTTGVTEGVANDIAKAINNNDTVVQNIATSTAPQLEERDILILGSSTWGYGELQDDWVEGIDLLKEVNLIEKTLAFFGVGDQVDWSDTFVDAMGILYENLAGSGANIVGFWPTEGYTFSGSKAVVGDNFVGLAIDDTNQRLETSSRIQQWTAELI